MIEQTLLQLTAQIVQRVASARGVATFSLKDLCEILLHFPQPSSLFVLPTTPSPPLSPPHPSNCSRVCQLQRVCYFLIRKFMRISTLSPPTPLLFMRTTSPFPLPLLHLTPQIVQRAASARGFATFSLEDVPVFMRNTPPPHPSAPAHPSKRSTAVQEVFHTKGFVTFLFEDLCKILTYTYRWKFRHFSFTWVNRVR